MTAVLQIDRNCTRLMKLSLGTSGSNGESIATLLGKVEKIRVYSHSCQPLAANQNTFDPDEASTRRNRGYAGTTARGLAPWRAGSLFLGLQRATTRKVCVHVFVCLDFVLLPYLGRKAGK